MAVSLKQKTAKGILWSAIERFSVQGLQFILGVVLAGETVQIFVSKFELN